MPASPLHAPLLAWYAATARDLPWRDPGRTPWGVLVSEVMLQQTPVEVGVAEAFVAEAVGFALVVEADGLGEAEVGVGVGLLDDEVVGEACGVPPPRPVSSQRTPRTRASRTTSTTARRNQ